MAKGFHAILKNALLQSLGCLSLRNPGDTASKPAISASADGQIAFHNNQRVIDHKFEGDPVTSKKAGGAATGTAGDENVMLFPNFRLEYHIVGTQTILAPVATAKGLNISMDQADNDGVELCPGILTTTAQKATVGATPAFFFETTVDVANVSGTDCLLVGVRKLEAYQAAAEDDYDEMFALRYNNGDLFTSIIDNGATTVNTDTTDNIADATALKIRINVSAAGVCTLLLNGQAPTTAQALTFDAAEVVVPFIFLRHSSGVAGTVDVKNWRFGLQSSE
jgi:hypothetical protein